MGYIKSGFAFIFLNIIDPIVYALISGAYSVFVAISKIDIFGTPGGKTFFNDITGRIYQTISIVMIFVFAYYLIMMIIDPDGKSGKSMTQLVKQTIISILLIIVLPTIFGYLSLFQTHVITNNTIGALILGQSGTDDRDPGQQIAVMLFSSSYHPDNTEYGDYFNQDGSFIGVDAAIEVCTQGGGTSDTAGNAEVCEAYANALAKWETNSTNSSSLKRTVGTTIWPISSNSVLRNAIDEEGGMYYAFILSTITGILAAWFFISYAIDLGVRAVKLAVLQLIAPVPVLLNIFPAGKKTFDAWFGQMKKTYIEVFVRLAVVFLAVELILMVPTLLSAVFDSTSGVTGGILTKALATIILILGILKFAKDCPQLFKDIFSSGGGLLAGLNFKPGVKKRIEDNDLAMKAGAFGIGTVGGAVASYWQSYKKKRDLLIGQEENASTNHSWSKARALLWATKDIPRGVVAGGKGGYKNRTGKLSMEDVANAATRGSAAGVAAFNENENLGENIVERTKTRVVNAGETFVENAKDFTTAFMGNEVNANIATESLEAMNKYLKNYVELAKIATDKLDNEFKTLKDEILRKGSVEYKNKVYTSNDISALDDFIKQQKREAIQKKVTKDGDYHEAANTYMATMLKDLSKNLSTLSTENMNKLNDIVKLSPSRSNSLEDLVKKLSIKNGVVEVGDIEAVQKVAKEMRRQKQNIVIANQVKQQEKAEKKEKKE